MPSSCLSRLQIRKLFKTPMPRRKRPIGKHMSKFERFFKLRQPWNGFVESKWRRQKRRKKPMRPMNDDVLRKVRI